MKKITTKMLIETIIIPMAIAYLYYLIFASYINANKIALFIVIIATCFEFIFKYLKEVHIYESKYNYLKIICAVLSFILIVLTVLNFFVINKIIWILFIVFVMMLLCFLLYFVIKRLKEAMNNKNFVKNMISSFVSLISFFVILVGMFIMLYN